MVDNATQLRKGVLELAILALLQSSPQYGGQIVDALAHAGLESSAGTVYPLLTRLAKAGLLSTQWRESPAGPPRKYYSITHTGKRALAAQARLWRDMNAAVNSLLGADHA
ncbi:MAG: PadR family transcriptional regulator [Ancrocorticia sp.]|jgi:PadR family transcriptional regulator PadR|nr:PadR family transcriptional regulator [Ancrocorticia sp.]MCI1896625.1 PadR family transcriptional regulator [Ancrocorticia sp.]MCI1933254.1 PadR family transcriptional regulator [Ancrocorticia sp.]MCI1963875.1 PadR family transcriptional regulator [Ancrocorticia sp.]MCI2001558.1 PadR family transcriptional regulator [Ancrocorticia sp.]